MPLRERQSVRQVFAEEPDHAVAIADCQSFLDPLRILPNTNGTRNRGAFRTPTPVRRNSAELRARHWIPNGTSRRPTVCGKARATSTTGRTVSGRAPAHPQEKSRIDIHRYGFQPASPQVGTTGSEPATDHPGRPPGYCSIFRPDGRRHNHDSAVLRTIRFQNIRRAAPTSSRRCDCCPCPSEGIPGSRPVTGLILEDSCLRECVIDPLHPATPLRKVPCRFRRGRSPLHCVPCHAWSGPGRTHSCPRSSSAVRYSRVTPS